MLVLSRTKNEGITIGGGIHVVVVDIRGDKVRLGVEAPRDTPVHRDEVQAAIDRQLARHDDSFGRITTNQAGKGRLRTAITRIKEDLNAKCRSCDQEMTATPAGTSANTRAAVEAKVCREVVAMLNAALNATEHAA